MNWLERARREIQQSVRRPTANSAERNLTAVMAAPHRALCENSGASIGSNDSASSALLPEIEAAREDFEERAAICEFDGDQDRARAELRAWREVAAIWYRQHGSRVPGDLCAGCRQPLGGDGEDVLLLPHGERVHAGEGYRCIIAYGQRWKGEAAKALAAIGIPTPPEIILAEGTSFPAGAADQPKHPAPRAHFVEHHEGRRYES